MSARWKVSATALIAAAALLVSTCLAEPTTVPTTTQATTKAAAPATQPGTAAPKAAPATQPAPKTELPRAKPHVAEPANIRFQFKGESYRDVVRFMASAVDKPILGDLNALQGTLRYFDAKPYTFTDALGIVNQVLRNAGFNLIDAGRYMELVQVNRMAQHHKLPLLLKGLDEEPPRADEEIVTTIIPLQYIDANQAVQIVARMVHAYGTLSKLESGKGIIITDTVVNIRRIQRLLQAIDKGTLVQQQLKYYRLQNASADEVGRLIERLFSQSGQARRRYVYSRERRRYEAAPADPSDMVTVTSDARSNTIVVIASQDNHTMISEIIEKLDIEQPAGAGAVRIFVLKNAKASELAKTLNAAVGTKTITVGVTKGRPVQRQVAAAKIVADDTTNRLIVSAEPDMMKQVEAMIKDLDEAATEAAGLQIFPLKVANAASLVGVIQNTFATRGPRGRMITTFTITAETRTNTLVVRAPVAEMEGIAKLIEEFDQQTATERDFHVVRLAAGDAREVARSLTNLLSRSRDPRRQTAEGGTRIEAERGTNSLIISAAPGDWAQIKSLLDKLTQEAPAAVASTRIFKLQHAKAAEVARTLQQIFDPRRRSTRRGQPQSIPVVVTHDTQSNSIIVSASSDDLAEIDKLLKPIDQPPEVAAQMQVRSYVVTNASATDLARSLTRLFAAQRGRRGAPADLIQPRFEAEPNTNTLVVAAAAEQFKGIEELIQRMQKDAQGSETVVKLFLLQHARADQLAPALTRVVQAEMEAMRRRGGARSRRSDFQVSVDTRSNALLVTAPAETITIIEQLIPKLDAPDLDVQLTKVIELENADPGELAAAINAALSGQPAPQRRGRRGPPVTMAALAGRQVVVVPEQSARAVLLTGAAEDVEFAEKLIKQIDARPSTEKATVQTFKLKHTKAEDIAGVLANTVGRMRRGPGAVPTSISADKNANALVVSAAGDVIERIEELLQQLDVEGAAEGAVTVEIVQLQHAKADQLATVLNAAQGTGQRRAPRGTPTEDIVQVTPDIASNSLLLSGRPPQIDETKKLIAQLDKTAAQGETVTQLVPVTNSDPREVADAINAALTGQAAPSRSRRGRTPISGLAALKGRRVTAVAAQSARAILLTGEKEDVAFAEELIQKIDARPPTDKAIVRTFKVKHAKAEDLAQVLSSTVGRAGRAQRTVPTSISADRNANAIVVSAPGDVIEQIEELLAQLDVEGATEGAVTVEIVPLQHAQADQLAAALNAAQGSDPRRRGQRGRGSAEEDIVRVTADTASNSLLLTGRPADIAEAKKLITELDKTAEQGQTITQIIPLSNADPNEVANAINAALAGEAAPPRQRRRRGGVPLSGLQGKKVLAVAAQSARAVLLTGQPEDVAFAAQLVQTIDERPATDKPIVRTFRVKHGKAEDLAEVLNATVGRLRRGRGAVPTSISADRNANAIVVSAPGEVLEQIEALLAELDVEGAAEGAVTIEIVRLVNAKADQMAAALNSAQGGGARPRGRRGPGEEDIVRVTADAAANSLLLTGRPAQIEETKKLIVQLDKAAAELTSEMRVFRLARAKAAEMVPMLERILLDQRGGRGRRGGPAVADVRIAAQERVNAVVMQGPPEAVALAEQIIRQFDGEFGSETVIQIVPLTKAEANSLADAVNQILTEQAARDRRGRPTATVDSAVAVPEVNSNSLLVRGTKVQVEQAVQLIKQLDQGGIGFVTQVRVFTLSNAEAGQAAKTIDLLFRQIIQQQQRRQGRNTPPPPAFSIADDERTNSVIISTSAANFEIVEPLLKKLDEEAVATIRDVQYIPLLHADAVDLATRVEAMFSDRKAGDRPVVEADELSNGLTIIGKDADCRAIEAVVQKWDDAAEANYITVRVLPLSNQVQAEEMAKMLQRLYEQVAGVQVQITDRIPERALPDAGRDLFQLPAPADPSAEGTSPTTQRARPAAAAAPETTTAPSSQPALGAAPQPPVIIAVDKESNSLVISAARTEIEGIELLIWDLTSTQAAADAEIRVFKVTTADPVSIAKTLNALFNPRPVATPRAPQQRDRSRQQAAPTPQPAKPSILIAADARTRCVIVRAKPVDLTRIENLITELDQPAVVISSVRIFQLKNTDATEVALNLRQLFQTTIPAEAVKSKDPKAQQQLIQRLMEARGPGKMDASGGISFSANRMTNSVVVAAPDEAMALIERIIQELDQSPAAGSTAVQMFPLEHAEVADVVDAVSRVFSRTAQPSGRGQRAQAGVVVTGHEATRRVIVSARVDQFPLIKEVIKELDQAGAADATAVRVYPLQHGDARSVATSLIGTLTQTAAGRGRGRTPTAPTSAVLRISPEPSANAIVVRASESEHERIAELIQKLDQPPAQQATFTTITLKRADARDVANALSRMLRSWPRTRNQPAPTVGFDAKTNTLMVSGRQEEMARIQAMIEKLEAGAQEQVQVQLIPIRNARAFEVAQELGAFYGPRAQGARPADREVTVVADERTNSILVSARPEQFADIAALIGKLDVSEPVGQGRTVVMALTYAQADAAARAIAQAFAPPKGKRVSPSDLVVATSEPATNALIVSASDENLLRIQALVKQLDVETTGGRTVEFIVLENAKATDLAKTLSAVVTRQRRPRRGATDGPPTVSAHAESNALVMAGKKADIVPLMDMAKQLDQVARGQQTEVHILPLKKADALDMADMVNRLFQDAARAARLAGKSVEPVAVSADVRANALIVVASEDQKRAVEKLVNEIDEMSAARAKMQLIQLKYANPEDVLKAIEQLYGSGANGAVRRPARQRTPGRASGPEATALTGQRALLINASEEEMKTILELVKAMDEAAQATKLEVLLFPLANASNTRLATALNSMYARAVRPGHPEDKVSIAPLVGTNAVVVTAAKEKMEEVAALIKQMDKVDVAPPTEFRLFPLTRAKAAKILPLLNQMLQPMRQIRPTQPIQVTADPTTNTIVVATQAPVLDEIEKIIRTLDNVQVFEAAEVMIIRLKSADATALAEALTDMLTPGTSKIQTPEAMALQEQIRLLRMVKGKEAIPPLDLSKPIKITADPLTRGQTGSNSLIISSTPDNLKALAEIVGLLDTIPIAEGLKLQIVHLKNADAITATTLLRDIFTQGWELKGRPATPTGARALQPEGVVGEALTHALNITADARTNTLILAGTEETVALAMLIINDLDRQPTSEFTQVKVFKLQHATAADLANLLRAVFAEQPAGVPGVEGAKAYVTRLRILRDKQRPVEAEVARSHPTFVVQAETKANILVVAARSDLIGIVDEVVTAMDIPGAGSMNVARIYPLKNADASRMSQVISGLYTGPNAALIRPEDKPTITVDVRTNSLVVSASDKTYLVIDALLAKLDAQLPIELRDIRLVPLANADALTLATTLQQMMDARVQRQVSLGIKDAEALRMIVVPDARSNCLIVGGSAEGFKVVADLAKQLDSASPALSGQIQLVPLTNANSGTLSATLNNLFNQRYQRAARTPDVRRQQPVIVPDLRTNSLMVAANQDDSKIIKSLVEKLDATPISPAVELVVLPLKFNDAGAVGPMIQQIFADRLKAMTPPTQQPAPQDTVSVATDALCNALVVSASKENLILIRNLLTKVDVEPPVETGVVRMYQLQHADVSRVESMLRALLTQGLYKPGLVGAGTNAIAQAREKVSITSDIRTNVLIVSASRENFAVLDEIVKRIDLKEGWGLTGNIRVYILKHADATRLGPVLQQMFDRKRAAEGATGSPPRSLPVVVIPDERTNSLLAAGSQEAFDALDELVRRLDASEVIQTYDFGVFYLKQASAATIQPILQQLFAQRRPTGRTPQPVTIIADATTNALIIGADKDDLAVAEGLIARLDTRPPEPGQVVRAFPVSQAADAAQLAQTLQQLFQAQRPGQPIGIAISVDERSNTILVSAAPADMNEIGDLVKKLDTAPLTDVTEIRIFTLRHADATQLATILTDALTNKPKAVTPESPNRATLLRFIDESPDGKRLVESAIKRGVMITAVPRTNSVLVQAPVETMPLLARLIRALDQTNPCTAEIRVFPLENADATQMAQALTELFRTQISATQRQAATYTMGPAANGGAPTTQPGAMFGSAEQNALTITVDRRTNSLLVGGTREYVDLVGTVISKLDASPAEDRQTMVYRLRNSQAGDIEQALRQFLDQERQRVVATLGADAVGAAKELLAREIAIVAEQTSNTLLISGSPRFFKTIWEMVRELDQPPPQVLVEVLLARVTLDDKTEFGVEWGVLAHPSNRTVAGGTAFGVGGSGFTFTVASGDLDLLLRALQSQGRLEIIQAPKIVAADNQQAEANIGQDVPYVTSSRVTEGGSVFNTVAHRQVGVILRVTPRINPDGFVTMTVRPEISSLAESTVEISEGLKAPVFDSSYAETTVTVQDGHTIVIAGLINKKEENREEKVPILGDIPLLGALFKSTKVVKSRSELLVILTPRVIRRPVDADVISNKMIRELGLSQGIHTDASIGQLLNPLSGVTPHEVRQLERGGTPSRRIPSQETVVIPMTPAKDERELPPEFKRNTEARP